MTDLPLSLALSSVLAAAVDGGGDRHALLSALAAGRAAASAVPRPPAGTERLAPVVPLRRPARPGRPGPDQPQAA